VAEALREDRAPAGTVELPTPAPALKPQSRARFWAVAAAVSLTLLGGLGITEATGVTKVRGTVIRLFSPEGTLEIQVDDPGISVQIDGSDFVITGAGAKEIRLKPGSYTVKGIRDGKVVTRELVTVTKDGKQVVRVSLKPSPPGPVEETPEEKAARLAREKEKGVATPTTDPDRRAAEYVFSLGGTVKVNEQDQEIKADADLPRESFRLTYVLLFEKPVTDAQLVVFKDCKNLTELILVGAEMVSVAGLADFKNCRNLTRLDLTRTNVTAKGLAHFGGCKNLAILTISGTEVTDGALAAFKNCKNLTSLDLSHTPIADAGLAPFKECKNLKTLKLNVTQVTDAGMANFKDCANLERLYLEGTQVGDVGLAHFKNCKNLEHLFLFGTQVSDAGLATFNDCKNLVALDLGGTRVGDVGLAHFKDCKNLFGLGLHITKVSDAGLVHLKDCKNLRGLDVRKSKVTATGIDKLKKTLPKCQIEWDGGVKPPK
jgi:Leucine-rich repeat (LRR) protein